MVTRILCGVSIYRMGLPSSGPWGRAAEPKAAKMPSIVISKPPVAGNQQDLPLLRGLWRAVVVTAKALMLGAVGAWVFGIAAAVATFYCYMIGVYLGIPLGFLVGVLLSTRVSAADTLFTFGLGFTTLLVLTRVIEVPRNSPEDGFLYLALPALLGALVAVFAFVVKGFVPSRGKQILGGVLCLCLAVWVIVMFLVRIYR